MSIPKIHYFMTGGIIFLLLFYFPYIFSFLQVLLSQSHRFRALVLLGRFLDMGPWAVDLVCSDLLCMYLFCVMFVVFSLYLVFNLWHFIVVGPVCRNISLFTQTTTNKCNGVTSNSSVYMDKNSLS